MTIYPLLAQLRPLLHRSLQRSTKPSRLKSPSNRRFQLQVHSNATAPAPIRRLKPQRTPKPAVVRQPSAKDLDFEFSIRHSIRRCPQWQDCCCDTDCRHAAQTDGVDGEHTQKEHRRRASKAECHSSAARSRSNRLIKLLLPLHQPYRPLLRQPLNSNLQPLSMPLRLRLRRLLPMRLDTPNSSLRCRRRRRIRLHYLPRPLPLPLLDLRLAFLCVAVWVEPAHQTLLASMQTPQ